MGNLFQESRNYRLRAVLWANRKSIVQGSICLLFVDVTVFTLPFLVKWMIDRLQNHPLPLWIAGHTKDWSTPQFLMAACAAYVLASIVIAVGRYYWRVFMIWSTFPWFHEMRMGLFNHLQNLNRDFFKFKKVGDLISALTTDTENMRMTAGIGTIMVIDATLNFILLPVLLWALSPTLTWMVVPPLVLVSFAAIVLTSRLSALYEKVQDLTADLSSRSFEMAAGVRVIKAFRKEAPLHRSFINDSEKLRDASLVVASYQSMFLPGLDLALSLALCWVLGYGGYLVMGGKLALSSLIAFQLYLNYMDWPMMAIGWFIQMFRQAEASQKRVVELADQLNPLVQTSRDPSKFTASLSGSSQDGLFRVEKISYRHPHQRRELFSDLSFTLQPAQWLGLTGPVGSGKSTLLELLSRQRDPHHGHIIFAGRDLKSLTPAEVRSRILYIPQETFVFSRSIRENLRLGLDTEDEVLWPLMESLAFDLETLKARGGISAQIGERGVNLSGGQKQRLSLGRALLRDREVYLFDDLFSHVDAETETKLMRALRRYLPTNAMVVLVSQRIETLSQCDQVFTLIEGRLEFKGPPSDAFKNSKFFGSLAELQQMVRQDLKPATESGIAS